MSRSNPSDTVLIHESEEKRLVPVVIAVRRGEVRQCSSDVSGLVWSQKVESLQEGKGIFLREMTVIILSEPNKKKDHYHSLETNRNLKRIKSVLGGDEHVPMGYFYDTTNSKL